MNKNRSHSRSSKAFDYRSDNGFAAVLLISLLPALICIGLIVPLGLHILNVQKAQRHECRVGLLEYQAIAKNTIQKLETLNILARALRIEKVVAMGMMLVPQTAVQGLRLFQQVQRQQKNLGRQQKAILTFGKTRMSYQVTRTNQKIRKSSGDTLLNISTTLMPLGLPTLALRPDNKSDDAPVYVREKDFTRKQTKQISWKSKFSFAGDGIWSKWTGVRSITQSQSCAATLLEEKSNLVAQLTKARSWPSFSSHFFF